MAKPKKDRNYEVGYGKPPRATQFAPGTSGNRRGRPKGAVGFKAILDKIVRERVVIKENGRRKTISKVEAVYKQLTNKAASGDLAAVKTFLWLLRMADGQTDTVATLPEHMSRNDEKVLEGMLRRLAQSGSKENK